MNERHTMPVKMLDFNIKTKKYENFLSLKF